MLRSGKFIRFTPTEIAAHREMGIHLDGVRTTADFADALAPWIEALGEVRPDLLEKLAQQIAEPKGQKLPPAPRVTTADDTEHQR